MTEDYKRRVVTLGEAAKRASLTFWEMEQELVASGFKSEYSADDLRRELVLLGKQPR